jgi:hypothetical protein
MNRYRCTVLFLLAWIGFLLTVVIGLLVKIATELHR